MSFKFFIAVSVTAFSALTFAQNSEEHVWKVLELDDGEKIWYDATELDTTSASYFDVWILRVHRPPMKNEAVDGEIYRTKTLYTINLNTVKYGIRKIRYYSVNNTELYKFDYDIPPPPENIKYSYPITENSLLYFLIKALYGPGGVKTGG